MADQGVPFELAQAALAHVVGNAIVHGLPAIVDAGAAAADDERVGALRPLLRRVERGAAQKGVRPRTRTTTNER
jgi:hypothetical protein